VPYLIGAHVDTISNLPPVRTAEGFLAPFVPETVIQVIKVVAVSTSYKQSPSTLIIAGSIGQRHGCSPGERGGLERNGA
jgi:hypothetical protein